MGLHEPASTMSETDHKVEGNVNIDNIKGALIHGSVLGGWFGAQKRLTSEGLPKNSRQTQEGYWIGSSPDLNEIKELAARNIKLVLTFATVPAKELIIMQQAYQALGITHVYAPFGSKFPNPNRFMPHISAVSPSQIFIHCEHGSDRTGAVLAYILIARHHWDIPTALFAVIQPTPCNIQKLTQILNSKGFKVNPENYEEIVGKYSAENNGGYGGMKVCSETGNYIRLIETLIKRAKAIPR